MTPRRFWHGPPAPRDSEIIKRANHIKLDLFRDNDGSMHGEMEVTFGVGMFGGEHEDYDGSKQADALAFMRRLLTEFENRKPDDGMAAAG